MLPSLHVQEQLLLARSNKFDSRPCSTSAVGPSMVVTGENVTTGNNILSNADMALEANMTLPCLQVQSNHSQDHASTDACKQGGRRQFTVRDISKDTCKQLPNIKPQGSDTVKSKPWSHLPMNVASNEDATCLLPPKASAL